MAKEPIAELSSWNTLRISSYFLYAHPDLDINHAEDQSRSIALIGSIFDPNDADKDNSFITKDILSVAKDIETIFSSIKRYAGSYILIYHDEKDFVIWSDARAVQEIYYCTENNLIICGSQPNLIAKFSNPFRIPSSDPQLLDFYNNHLWDSRWVGDETYFEGIKHLLPNHYLDINKLQIHRYWPNEFINPLCLEDAVTKSCTYLQGIMRAIVNRHSVMMAVTGGTDSRTLLAASKGILKDIYYFVNRTDYDDPDITIPKNIFNKIDRKFQVHDVPKHVDDIFRKVYFNNTFLANERLLPSIYNILFKDHSNKILILGVGEIGRTFYGLEPKKLNSYRAAYKLGYTKSAYVIDQCEKYLTEMLPVAKKFGVNPMIILYWEQRLGNWAATRNSESKIAIDKIDPYNSHLLNEIFLGVDERYKDYQADLCILFREIIRSMWPELLDYPVNPSVTMRDKIKTFMIKIQAYEILKEFKYQLSYGGYLCRKHSKANLQKNRTMVNHEK
jgi:hypothetical protein